MKFVPKESQGDHWDGQERPVSHDVYCIQTRGSEEIGREGRTHTEHRRFRGSCRLLLDDHGVVGGKAR